MHSLAHHNSSMILQMHPTTVHDMQVTPPHRAEKTRGCHETSRRLTFKFQFQLSTLQNCSRDWPLANFGPVFEWWRWRHYVTSLANRMAAVAEVSDEFVFNLQAYLRRVGLSGDGGDGDGDAATLAAGELSTLTKLMHAQARAIPFENLNVVVGGTVSMSPADVQAKLVGSQRGGYCFEVSLSTVSLILARPTTCACKV